MIQSLKIFGMAILLGITWAIHVFHLGALIPPVISISSKSQVIHPGLWIDKSKFGIHQLLLSGAPYERGLEAGRLTRDLLYREEKELIIKLREFIPNSIVLETLKLLAIRWFWGIEAYFEPGMLQEMDGVSKSASDEFKTYADAFTRQVAYHGLHEVSQMTVDQGADDVGCTVVAVPFGHSWVIGRNFDFEGGQIFDSEKIMKWVFPDEGYAFVSVTWAGMVGAVTGVNENGVYISLNAAGSTDFRRHGTPSTLVLLKALLHSRTAQDAVRIIREETMFITDIFVIADRSTGKAYRLEKSPRRVEVFPLDGASTVTNHLIGKSWKNDRINQFRRDELTSNQRAKRGQALLQSFTRLSPKEFASDARAVEELVLSVIRDKGEDRGKPLTLGNRKAIDALIAAHSVIYNAETGVFYVSQGPGVSGPFTGFDLPASFASGKPVVMGSLPRDPLVTDQVFLRVRNSAHEVAKAISQLDRGQCDEGWRSIVEAKQEFSESSGYYSALGDFYQCKGKRSEAREAWRKALDLSPAYPRQVRELERKLKP